MNIYHTRAEVMELDWEVNRARGDIGVVYMVVDKVTSEVVYIGQTGNPRHRLTPHCHPVYRRELHDLYIYRVANRDERLIMEGNLIDLFQPRMNVRKGAMLTQPDILDRVYGRIFDN